MNTKEKIIEKFKKWIAKTNVIDYDTEIGFDCDDKELVILRDSETQKEVYVVSFKTNDKETLDKDGKLDIFIEGMYCFAYYDAETLELLYIHKNAGYIEVDGSL
jgi:hypothetical protein